MFRVVSSCSSFTRLNVWSAVQSFSSSSSPSHLPSEFWKSLPKTELHLHLDGSVRPASLLEMIKKQNIRIPGYEKRIPSLEEFQSLVVASEQTSSLRDYLQAFDYTLLPLQDPEAIEQAMWEIAEDCGADGIKYLEIRFCPELHTKHGLSSKEVLEIVLSTSFSISASARSNTSLPIVRILLCGVRHLGLESVIRCAELCKEYYNHPSKQLVGFDLAGAEAEYPTEMFREAFKIVHKANIPITIHAGEAAGWESVYEAVLSGASRIGHGCALQHNRSLLKELADEHIAVEICLTSNVFTKAHVEVANHPLKLFLKNHLPCSLCTDSITVVPTTLSKEYSLAYNKVGVSVEDIIRLSLSGFRMSFLPTEEKTSLLQDMTKETINLLQKYEIDVDKSIFDEFRQ